MPGSTSGTAHAAMPSAPPAIITPTKAAGQTHRARPPLRPAHRPDRHHRQHMIEARPGMLKPAANETACSSPVWASAGPLPSKPPSAAVIPAQAADPCNSPALH